MRVLLDTNAHAALLRGDERVAARVRRSARVLLPSIVAGELLFGLRNGSRYEENLGELEESLANPIVEVLPVTAVTADRFHPTTSGLPPMRWMWALSCSRLIGTSRRSTDSLSSSWPDSGA